MLRRVFSNTRKIAVKRSVQTRRFETVRRGDPSFHTEGLAVCYFTDIQVLENLWQEGVVRNPKVFAACNLIAPTLLQSSGNVSPPGVEATSTDDAVATYVNMCITLELLARVVNTGDTVLDLGTGSGFIAACLAHLVRSLLKRLTPRLEALDTLLRLTSTQKRPNVQPTNLWAKFPHLAKRTIFLTGNAMTLKVTSQFQTQFSPTVQFPFKLAGPFKAINVGGAVKGKISFGFLFPARTALYLAHFWHVRSCALKTGANTSFTGVEKFMFVVFSEITSNLHTHSKSPLSSFPFVLLVVSFYFS
jgi:hypothetical protein